MQIAQDSATNDAALSVTVPERSPAPRGPYADYNIIRRNGAVVGFEPTKLENPHRWTSQFGEQLQELLKERNFFETRVIEYQTGGALSWD
jgi:hypothetical protein